MNSRDCAGAQRERELVADCFPPLYYVLRSFGSRAFSTLEAVLAARPVLRIGCSYWQIRAVLLSGVAMGALRFEGGRFHLAAGETVLPRDPRKEWKLCLMMLRLFKGRAGSAYEPSPEQREAAARLARDFCSLPNRRGFLLVNRAHPLPENYRPEGLVMVYGEQPHFLVVSETLELQREAADAAEEMAVAAAGDGLHGLLLLSGYRSRAYQAELFAGGKPGYVARPGTSEHETGLAMDISVETGDDTLFEDTPHFAWLREKAWRYGIILRYPEGRERFTGVFYEPHHFRFVGKEAARAIYEAGLSLEEYCAEAGGSP